MNSLAWEILTYCVLSLGTGAVGIVAVCTNSWLPMIAYPLVWALTVLLAVHTGREIARS